MSDLQQRLRRAADTLRRTSMPLADLIPLLQQAADALEAQPAQAVPLLTEDELWDLWNAQGCDDMNQVEASAFARAIESLVRSKLGAGVGWQPIETAPKDGTAVLIFRPDAPRNKVIEVYWATPWDGAPHDQCWWATPHGPAGRGYTILPSSVTHWMPLPPPPDNKTETAE